MQGTYIDGGYTDLGYTLTLMFFSLSAIRTIVSPAEGPAGRDSAALEPDESEPVKGNLWLPNFGLLIAFALIIWTHFNPQVIDFTVASLVFGGIIVVLTAREVVAVRENASLYREQRQLTEVLSQARDDLERRVDERTCELEEANEALAQEVAQHRQTEAKLAATNQTLALEAAEHKQARAELQPSLTEKEVLLKEVHHRVKNNLQVVSSLLALQSRATLEAGARQALLESQARVRAMSLIHQKLYSSTDLARIDFGEYLQNLVEHLIAIYNADPDRISLRVEAMPVRLNIDSAMPCGLIVNELIANALEHAFPDDRKGFIYVRLAQDSDGRIEVSVRDDGVGLPEDLDVRRSRSLGLLLISTLASQLGAELRVECAEGAAFTLLFESSPP
jgi:two-component sensor histidine kinase